MTSRAGIGSVRGVTLIEMIVVIAITGILAAAVAVFMRRPVEGYIDAVLRAGLTDVADTALRRMTRDLRIALPNSIRVDATGLFIEYLQTTGGGRYRAELTAAGGGDPLDFTTPAGDSTFDVVGPMPALAAGNFIVIFNLNADPSVTTANAYNGDNRGNLNFAGSTASTIALSPAFHFPFASPGKRFQVVQYPVTYGCNLATGVLTRYWGYTIQLSPQPTPPAGGSNAPLATNVTGCSFSYVTSGATQRTGVVALNLQVAQSGETVSLFQQVHVNNVP